MQRVHISPRLGPRSVDEIRTREIDVFAASMLETGLAPKTVRNVLAFLHAVFEHALDRGYVRENPVRRAKRPGRRRRGDRNRAWVTCRHILRLGIGSGGSRSTC